MVESFGSFKTVFNLHNTEVIQWSGASVLAFEVERRVRSAEYGVIVLDGLTRLNLDATFEEYVERSA